jgi:hypothetical protein
MTRTITVLSCLVLVVAIGCREPYNPTVISSSDSYLVVEGILNASHGPTNIRLSRTYKLDDSATLRGENNAQVIVEGKDNSTRLLTMVGEGLYHSPDLGLTIDQEYRLKITTANGKEYMSEYVMAKQNAPIDSLEFEQSEKGVQIYANTHDNTNRSRYYLWNFEETWEIHTFYYSWFKYENEQVVPRGSGDRVSICWKYDFSKNILLGTSASLQSDVITRAPITFIPNFDEKLAVRYSILLRQYALDKRGYDFYELMKKNTESLGTLFDAQPSEMRGNIRCISDPGELVIGYVSASAIEEKRFFILKDQLHLGWRYPQDCPKDDIPNVPDSIKLAYQLGFSIIDEIRSRTGDIVGWNVSKVRCVDCTRRGGSLLKPSYW